MSRAAAKTFLLIVSLTMSVRILAQPVTALTLDQALNLARQNSLKLRISERELEKTALAKSELRASGLPQVSAKSEVSYAPDARHFGYDPAITDGGQLSGQVSVEQSVYDGGTRNLKMVQLSLDLDKLHAKRLTTERDLIADVKQRFVDLLLAQQEEELQQASVNQLQSYYDIVRSMNEGGIAPYTDVLKTQVDLSNAIVMRDKAGSERFNSILALEAAVGLAPDTSLRVVGSLGSLAEIRGDSLVVMPLDSMLRTIEILNAELDIRRSEMDVQVAQREHRPLIDLTADAGYLSSRDNLAVPVAERYSGLGVSVGVNASLSLFNGGATRFRIQQAQMETDALRLQRQALQRALAAQLHSLKQQIQSAAQLRSTQQEIIKTAEQNYLLNRSTYAGGGASATEVLAAQQLLRDARLSDLETKATIAKLWIQWKQAMTTYDGVQR